MNHGTRYTGSLPHTVAAVRLTELVEEYRPTPGCLDSLREHKKDLFQPAEAKDQGKEEEQVAYSWRHSGVPLGEVKNYQTITYQYPAVWQPDPPHPADIIRDACPLTPLLLALYDPLGCGGDWAHLHWAHAEAVDDYMHWYRHPAATAHYLKLMEAALNETEKDANWFLWPRVKLTRSRLPKSGWKNFLAWYHQDEELFAQYFTDFFAAWSAWLRHEGPDGLLAAFQDYAPGQWKAKERAFLACHYYMTVRPEGVSAARDLYIGSRAGGATRDLFLDILQAGGNEPTRAANDILRSFMGTIMACFRSSENGWGDLGPLMERRIRAAGYEKTVLRGENLSSVWNQFLDLQNGFMPAEDWTALQAVVNPPVHKTVCNIWYSYQNYKSPLHSKYKPSPPPQLGVFRLIEKQKIFNDFATIFNYGSAIDLSRHNFLAYAAQDPDAKPDFGQAIAVFSAIAGLLLIPLARLETLAFHKIAASLWIPGMLYDIIRSYHAGYAYYGSAQLGLFGLNSLFSLMTLMKVNLPWWSKYANLVLLLGLAYCAPTELENWLASCYWADLPGRNSKIHTDGLYRIEDTRAQRSFSYASLKKEDVATKDSLAARDMEALMRIICTPSVSFNWTSTQENGVPQAKGDDVLTFHVIENLFNPSVGQFHVKIYLDTSYLKNHESGGRSGEYRPRTGVLINEGRFAPFWTITLSYDLFKGGPGIARYAITRKDLFRILYSLLPRSAASIPQNYVLTVVAAYEEKGVSYPAKILYQPAEYMQRDEVYATGDHQLIDAMESPAFSFF